MSLYFKEYLNSKVIDHVSGDSNIHFKENFSSNSAIGQPNTVIAEIEGLHNVRTGNYTLYTEAAMLSSVNSWTYPYNKALIMHHDEDDGEVVGRVRSVSVEDSKVLKGSKALCFVTDILGQKNQEATLDGRNSTVSVGVVAHDVTCSICGQQLANGETCEHQRGNIYDDNLCIWIINKMSAKELSFVNLPSDHYAQVTNKYRLGEKGVDSKMKLDNAGLAESQEANVENLNLTEGQDKDLEESKSIENKGIQNGEGSQEIIDESEKEIIKALHREKKELEALLRDKDEDLLRVSREFEELKDKISNLQDIIIKKDEEVSKEKALRESLESELSSSKDIVKKELVKKISNLREKNLGLETDVKAFSERSIESLKDTIVDLKEQIDNNVSDKIGTVLQEGLVDETQTEKLSKQSKVTKKQVEDDKIKPKFNLSEQLKSIF